MTLQFNFLHRRRPLSWFVSGNVSYKDKEEYFFLAGCCPYLPLTRGKKTLTSDQYLRHGLAHWGSLLGWQEQMRCSFPNTMPVESAEVCLLFIGGGILDSVISRAATNDFFHNRLIFRFFSRLINFLFGL